MKPISFLLAASLLLFAKSQAQTIPGTAWCQQTKAIIAAAQKDARKLAGKQTDSTEYRVTYVCKMPVAGADSVRIEFYPDGGRVARIIAYYGDRATKKQYDKVFASLSQHLKNCFGSADNMSYPHELGYGKAVCSLKQKEYYKICVGTQSEAVVDRFPGIMTVIEFF